MSIIFYVFAISRTLFSEPSGGGKILRDTCTLSLLSFPFYRWENRDPRRRCLARFSQQTVVSEWKRKTGTRRTGCPESGFWAGAMTPFSSASSLPLPWDQWVQVSAWALADRTVLLGCLPGLEDTCPHSVGGSTAGRCLP